MMAAVLIAAVLAKAEPPTQNGDHIGVAKMHGDGRITLQLRSVECNGMIAEGVTETRAGDAHYRKTIDWLGGLLPGQTKSVIARDVPPCPRR